MLAVVCLNTCLDRTIEVPDLRVGAVLHATWRDDIPAGKGTNVARLLAALGRTVPLYGLVGSDMASRFRESLDAAGVEERLTVHEERTRINTTLLDPARQTETHLRERGPRLGTAACDRVEEALVAGTREGDTVVFCGSLPPGFPPDAFGALLRRLGEAGRRVGADASEGALVAAEAAGALLLKPNRTELEDLLDGLDDGPDAFAHACATLAARRPGRVVLGSDGPRGACLATPEGIWTARPVEATAVVNTVGAGDALLAGYLDGLLADAPPPERLARAVRVATASLCRLVAGEIAPDRLDARVEVRPRAPSPA